MSSKANRDRRAIRVPALSLALVALAACTTNPATGRNSEVHRLYVAATGAADRRIEEHPKILATFGGAYDDAGIAAYVAA